MFPNSKIPMLSTNMLADLEPFGAGLSVLDLIMVQAINRWPSAGSTVRLASSS